MKPVPLHSLAIGQRFRFNGCHEGQAFELVHKGTGRATIRRLGAAPTSRTFETVQGKVVTISAEPRDEPCALGADVLPLEETCPHNWVEVPGEPAMDVCNLCGASRG